MSSSSQRLSKASTHIFSPRKEEEGIKVAQNFIDSLLYNLTELLHSYTNLTLSVDDQMQKLYEGVRFLSILLVEKYDKFTALDDEVKDLIWVVIIDAGILICSLSLDELKQGLAKESDLALSHWLRVLEFIMSEAVQIHSPTSSSSSSSSSFCKTNELGSFDLVLQHLKELTSTEAESIAFLKVQFHTIQDDLAFLRSFLENIAEQRYHNNELQTLWDSIMEVAHKTEYAIDLIIFQMANDKLDCPPVSLSTITKEINSLKIKVRHSMRNVDTSYQRVTKTAIHMPTRVCASALKSDEVVMGLHKELNTIIDGLTRGSDRLDIISIVGMPGLGKTTLASKVYNHPSITHHFHFQAWCTVSQVYSKQDLLLQIMGDVVSKNCDQNDENDLAENLYKHLKGKRYLIILDNVWQVDAFNLLKESFPDDKKGSRLLITSRYQNLCSRFKDHKLPLLTNEKSWELLQIKLFGGGYYPPALGILGKQIAEHCKGLPLTVVLVAGILANYEQNCWEDVVESLSTFIEIEEQCRETLELSYKNLPDYLKPCLLYLGAFPEDQDISVKSLLCLWISEGFVQYSNEKSLEEAANEYLMNLIGRSLVMVIK